MLRELQRDFVTAIWNESSAVLPQIRADRFSADQHLQIYRNNILGTLTTALGDVYPVTEKLVGSGFFGYAAHEYLRDHRPLNANLHDFGGAFAGFLADFPPAQSLPYLPDVARLEWAWHRALHAAEAMPFDPVVLAAVPEEHHGQLRFGLHPSAHLLHSSYPILRIFEIHQEDFHGDMNVNLETGENRVLVIRRGIQVRAELLSAGEYALLSAFLQNRCLDDALHAALAAEPPFDLNTVLASHARRGTLANLRSR